MTEELGWVRPFVVLELPGLTRGEDTDDARPIFGLELLGGVDDDEADWAGGVDAWDQARNVKNRSAGGSCGKR